jgi:hypothetical protein
MQTLRQWTMFKSGTQPPDDDRMVFPP